MTQDEIIEMAESLGVREYGPRTRNWSFELSLLEAFAKLVEERTAAKEREACLKAGVDACLSKDDAVRVCAAIRARGQE